MARTTFYAITTAQIHESTTSTMTKSNARSVRGLALLSGFLGATASLFAKFAFEPHSSTVDWVRSECPRLFVPPVDAADAVVAVSRWHSTAALALCSTAELAPRGIFLLVMIACNAAMLGSFLEGMQESGSVAGTALSSAANFATSACLGGLFLGERFPLQWWLGFGMVVGGAMLLATVRVKPAKVTFAI